MKRALKKFGRGLERAGPLLQSLASLVAVVGLLLAAIQFLRGEELMKNRQRNLAEVASQQCQAVAEALFDAAANAGDPDAWTSAARNVAANNGLLSEIPLSEMPSAQAVSLLATCRLEADAVANGTFPVRDSYQACDRAASLTTIATLLHAQAERPSTGIETSDFDRTPWRQCDRYNPNPGTAPDL